MSAIRVLITSLVFAVGCASSQSSQSERIDVTAENDLGVVAIELARFADHGDKVFELRGLDGNDGELAAVRLRTGEIAELPSYLPDEPGTFGSEIILSVLGKETRSMSHELAVHQLQPQEPVMQGFLELEAVSSALARENILINRQPTQNTETPYVATGCYPTLMMNSPLAGQCCFNGPSIGFGTLHINYGNNTYSYRAGPSSPCTNQDGSGNCGRNCYYGPQGFAHPVVTSGTGTPIVLYQSASYGPWSDSWCVVVFYASNPPAPMFPDVVGTNAPATCPGSNGGGGVWGY